MNGKTVVGSIEEIEFPKFNMSGILAKVDTGASSSSLHCKDIELRRDDDGKVSRVCFTITHPEDNERPEKRICAPKARKLRVYNSFGEMEKRYSVYLTVKVAGEEVRTEFSLSNRDKMTYPVLLGRQLLNGSFIVDVEQGPDPEK